MHYFQQLSNLSMCLCSYLTLHLALVKSNKDPSRINGCLSAVIRLLMLCRIKHYHAKWVKDESNAENIAEVSTGVDMVHGQGSEWPPHRKGKSSEGYRKRLNTTHISQWQKSSLIPNSILKIPSSNKRAHNVTQSRGRVFPVQSMTWRETAS